MLPLVAIIGRPNVGKSALFNRMIGKRHAIVSDVYGTTRDILSGIITLKKREIEIVDTAGIMSFYDGKDPLDQPIQDQAREAMHQADLILFLVDGTVPLTTDDLELAKQLRRSDKPVLFIITKCDTDKIVQEQGEVYRIGMEEPIFISSIHNRGISELLDRIHAELKDAGFYKRSDQHRKEKTKDHVSFCIVGKPNVGKSSLFNALTKAKKAVVSDIAGTTRDTVDSEVVVGDKTLTIIDTAGLRRPGKIEMGIEKYSVLRTMRAITRSDVCLFVIDGNEKVSNMDHAVSRYILEANKGLIIVVNKWDLLEGERTIEDRFLTYLQDKFDYLPWAPVMFVSAQTGRNVNAVFELVASIYDERFRRVETGKFNRFIDEVQLKNPPTGTKKVVPKILYATQIETNPPHFLLFVNYKEAFHFSWMRYFEKELRKKFGFTGTPIIIEMRDRDDREKKKK